MVADEPRLFFFQDFRTSASIHPCLQFTATRKFPWSILGRLWTVKKKSETKRGFPVTAGAFFRTRSESTLPASALFCCWFFFAKCISTTSYKTVKKMPVIECRSSNAVALSKNITTRDFSSSDLLPSLPKIYFPPSHSFLNKTLLTFMLLRTTIFIPGLKEDIVVPFQCVACVASTPGRANCGGAIFISSCLQVRMEKNSNFVRLFKCIRVEYIYLNKKKSSSTDQRAQFCAFCGKAINSLVVSSYRAGPPGRGGKCASLASKENFVWNWKMDLFPEERFIPFSVRSCTSTIFMPPVFILDGANLWQVEKAKNCLQLDSISFFPGSFYVYPPRI